MGETLEAYCKRTGSMELLEQWDRSGNLPLTPEEISRGSKQKVWWQCRQGHRWQAKVNNRTTGHTGCPYCAGRAAWPGESDLATRYAQLAEEWHPIRNLPLTPSQVLPGSRKKVWWRCRRGHEWQAQIRSRVEGSGCPVCANRIALPGKNDLANRFPELARQWHPVKNGALTPGDVTPGTKHKVWWRCDRGHEWRASVLCRTQEGTGCPVCTGRVIQPGENDLASRFPQLAGEWHPTRNGALLPTQVSPSSKRRVWWRCPLGHEYIAEIGMRTIRGSGCPYCAGKKVLAGFNDLATTQPQLAREWHPTLNGRLTPEMVTAGSHKKVWWKCAQGHVWKAVVYSRTGRQRRGCPVCAGVATGKRKTRYEAMLAEVRRVVVQL